MRNHGDAGSNKECRKAAIATENPEIKQALRKVGDPGLTREVHAAGVNLIRRGPDAHAL